MVKPLQYESVVIETTIPGLTLSHHGVLRCFPHGAVTGRRDNQKLVRSSLQVLKKSDRIRTSKIVPGVYEQSWHTRMVAAVDQIQFMPVRIGRRERDELVKIVGGDPDSSQDVLAGKLLYGILA